MPDCVNLNYRLSLVGVQVCIESQVKVYIFLAIEVNYKWQLVGNTHGYKDWKMCMKWNKHFIINRMGYMDLCASIPRFHHQHHLLAGELNAPEDLRSSLKSQLAFVATNERLRETNGIRRLHEEDNNNNTNTMSKLRNNKNREGKKLFGKKKKQQDEGPASSPWMGAGGGWSTASKANCNSHMTISVFSGMLDCH